MPAPLIVEEHYPTALELLGRLSPWDPLWQGTGGQSYWWFRGQRDSAWSLEPSAMRIEFRLRGKGWGVGVGDRSVTPTNRKEQLQYEQTVVREFLRVCEDSALPIPEDSQWLRSADSSAHVFKEMPHADSDVDFPFFLLRSLYALAQHHGVPTRLLDWTQLPLVAAYFACERVAREMALHRCAAGDTKSDKCAIFALRTAIAFDRLGQLQPALVEVSAPYDSNPNLRAQRGRFSLMTYSQEDDKRDFRLPSIERLIKEVLAPDWWSEETDLGPMLCKFTLPHSECRGLLRLLAEANVHAATVFPNYDSAVRAVDEIGWHAETITQPRK